MFSSYIIIGGYVKGNFLQRMGFYINKVSGGIAEPAEEDAAPLEKTPEQLELEAFQQKGSEQVMSIVREMLPKTFWEDLIQHNDMTCIQWGGPKVARLYDLSVAMLDDAMRNLRFEQTDRFKVSFGEEEVYGAGGKTDWSQLKGANFHKVAKIFLLMSLLAPLPIKQSLKMKDVESILWPQLLDMIVNKHKLVSEVEADLILAGVFYSMRMKPGNPLLDIFHDALQLETSQYDKLVDKSILRTPLAQESSYLAFAVRRSRANICPGWIVKLAEEWGLPLLDETMAKRAASRGSEDCF